MTDRETEERRRYECRICARLETRVPLSRVGLCGTCDIAWQYGYRAAVQDGKFRLGRPGAANEPIRIE